jgi:D-xylose transport system substrate-binding protein
MPVRARRTWSSIAALGAAAALGLGSCSSSDSSNPDPAPGVSSAAGAACEVDVPGSSAPPRFPRHGRTSGTVGVILPVPGPAAPSSRQDGALLTTALRKQGLTPRVDYAPAHSEASVALARSLVGNGIGLLVVGSLGRSEGVRIERIASRAGVEVIEYGGVTLGGSAPYFVSFDYQDVGRLQAQTMISCLQARGVTEPRIILVDGGTDVDENAVLMALGAHQVLDQLVAAGSLHLQEETAVKGWDAARAGPAFEQALDASDGQVDGVLAADDEIADAVIGVLRTRGMQGAVLAGEGAGTQGLRNVLTGRQSMTVLRDPALQADAAARLAAAVLSGSDVALAAAPLTPFADPLAPSRGLAGVLVPARPVTQATLEDVVRSGEVTIDDLCRGLIGQCAALGVS